MINYSDALHLSNAKKQARLAEFRTKALEIEIALLKEDLEREIAFNEKLTERLLETGIRHKDARAEGVIRDRWGYRWPNGYMRWWMK